MNFKSNLNNHINIHFKIYLNYSIFINFAFIIKTLNQIILNFVRIMLTKYLFDRYNYLIKFY